MKGHDEDEDDLSPEEVDASDEDSNEDDEELVEDDDFSDMPGLRGRYDLDDDEDEPRRGKGGRGAKKLPKGKSHREQGRAPWKSYGPVTEPES